MEQHGEVMPSSVSSARKQKKIIAWERLEITSRKSEIPSECFIQRYTQSRTEMART